MPKLNWRDAVSNFFLCQVEIKKDEIDTCVQEQVLMRFKNFDERISDEAEKQMRTAITDVVRGKTWEILQEPSNQRKIEEIIRKSVGDFLKEPTT